VSGLLEVLGPSLDSRHEELPDSGHESRPLAAVRSAPQARGVWHLIEPGNVHP